MEFAILLPLLLFIVFGITEFGRALYSYNTIVKATRDAARFYSTQQPGNPPTAENSIKNLAVYGNTAGTGSPLAPGLTTDMVTLYDWQSFPTTHQSQGAAPVVNLVTVTVSGYTFHSFVPFVTAGLASFTFAPISTTMKGNL